MHHRRPITRLTRKNEIALREKSWSGRSRGSPFARRRKETAAKRRGGARKERERGAEEREQEQREQMERVERQAKELEDRLARLATSMPPSVAVLDPEATQVSRGGIRTEVMGNNSFPGAAEAASQRGSQFEISIPGKKKNSIVLIGGIVLVTVLIVGTIAAYFLLRSNTTSPGVGQSKH